mgnify:CR=1 FL=1
MKARLLALLDALAMRAAGRSLRSGIPLLLLTAKTAAKKPAQLAAAQQAQQ